MRKEKRVGNFEYYNRTLSISSSKTEMYFTMRRDCSAIKQDRLRLLDVGNVVLLRTIAPRIIASFLRNFCYSLPRISTLLRKERGGDFELVVLPPAA